MQLSCALAAWCRPDARLGEQARYLVSDRLPRAMDQPDELLSGNEDRHGPGVASATSAWRIDRLERDRSMIRAGLLHDIRKARPYSIYDRFDFRRPDAAGRRHLRPLLHSPARSARASRSRQRLRHPLKGEFLGGKGGYTFRPGGRSVRPCRGAQGRAGLLRRQRRQGQPISLSRQPQLHQLERIGTDGASATKIADAVVILGAIDIVLGG